MSLDLRTALAHVLTCISMACRPPDRLLQDWGPETKEMQTNIDYPYTHPNVNQRVLHFSACLESSSSVASPILPSSAHFLAKPSSIRLPILLKVCLEHALEFALVLTQLLSTVWNSLMSRFASMSSSGTSRTSPSNNTPFGGKLANTLGTVTSFSLVLSPTLFITPASYRPRMRGSPTSY